MECERRDNGRAGNGKRCGEFGAYLEWCDDGGDYGRRNMLCGWSFVILGYRRPCLWPSTMYGTSWSDCAMHSLIEIEP